eukprot:TRINITY_DN12521_c0_g1_i1.p1 TRINITY_DN12521_c0_g1~~TRINITY_DN12521_c0_g1_i1.p1  ORF type:complete len:394 (+),score=50.34 TRINITY_DN12521_c0_g1_i1:98-1279(+)
MCFRSGGMTSAEGEVVSSVQNGPPLFDRASAPRRRPLTALRLARGVFFIVHLISTVSVSLIVFAPVVFFLLRLVDIQLSRRLVCFLFGSWLSTYPLVFEAINGCQVVFTGDQLPLRERALVIVNHRTEVDWMYLWSLAYRKGRIGELRFALKSTVRNVPIFGWAFYCLEFLLLDRQWESDQFNIEAWVDANRDPQEPLWLVIFPEGTDFSEEKREKSWTFAAKRGLPLLNNVLLPRTRGFISCFMPLRYTFDAVYDLTIGYNYRDPTFLDSLFGVDPEEVHIHSRRFPVSQVPTGEKELERWLFEIFEQKDKLLSTFYGMQSFSCVETSCPLHTLPCVASLIGFALSTSFFCWAAYCFAWVRLYMIASCVLLASATYLKWKPQQLFGNVGINM